MIGITTFKADITPPVGHPLAAGWYPPAIGITDRLWALGIVLTGAGKPAVLCALDWVEVSNREHLRWRRALAEAAGTDPDRVAVHCTHTHSSPWPDREAQDILDREGLPNVIMDGSSCERARDGTAEAVRTAMARMRSCTHVSAGRSRVEGVASNRRVMGADGRVKAIRWTKTLDPAVRAEPEGLIDPVMKTVAFWDRGSKAAVLHYYAVHPTSYDGDGLVTPEFVGLARDLRRDRDGGILHVYFTGCAGNVTAGKYNDGNPANRPVLTERILRAMEAGEEEAQRVPLRGWTWRTEPVLLPPREDLDEEALLAEIRDPRAADKQRSRAAMMLTYLHRRDLAIPVTCLRIDPGIAVLHLPGETFIEYQLEAEALVPDTFLAVAAYGDLGTGYITRECSFAEGGYEPTDAFVSGKSEPLLREAIRRLLS